MTQFTYTAIPVRTSQRSGDAQQAPERRSGAAAGQSGSPRAGAAAGVVAGRQAAPDERSLRDRLREQGLIPIDVRPVSRMDGLRAAARAGRLRAADSAWFFQTLRRLLAGKVPVETAVTTMQGLAARPALTQACGDVREALRSGATLADAVERCPGLADAQTLALLRVGHESGRLQHVTELIDRSMAFRRAIRKAVIGKLTYPAVVLAVALVAICVLAWFVIPGFASTLRAAGAELPLSTRVTLAASKWIVWVVPLLAVAGVVLWRARSAAAPPALRAWLQRVAMRTPVVGALAWHAQGAVAADTLATIIEGGGDLLTGMEQAERAVWSDEVRTRLRDARRLVREGQDLGEALAAKGVLPPMPAAVVRVGLKTGDLAGSLRRATEMCVEKQEELTARLLTFLEPAILLALAGVVGWVFYSLVAGIMTMNDLGAV